MTDTTELPNRLRDTVQHFAHTYSGNMVAWNKHANRILSAADALEALQTENDALRRKATVARASEIEGRNVALTTERDELKDQQKSFLSTIEKATNDMADLRSQLQALFLDNASLREALNREIAARRRRSV